MKVHIGLLQALELETDHLLGAIKPGINRCRISFLAKCECETILAELSLRIDDNPDVNLLENNQPVKILNFIQNITCKYQTYIMSIEIKVENSITQDCLVGLKLTKSNPYSPGCSTYAISCLAN